MRPRRSDSASASSSPQKAQPVLSTASIDEPPPNLEAESEDNEQEVINKTENKNPQQRKSPQKRVPERVEKSASFTPPPALSPAYSIQNEDVKMEEEEEEEELKLKMEVEEDKSEVKPKKEVEKRAKMKYKKRGEKEKDAVPFIDPNAPKRNRSAYVHFIISRRASYSKAVMSQRDINISLAADWQKLSAEERIPFHKKAEEEKEKYIELMEEYKKTDSHREFQKARSKFLTSQGGKNRERKRKHSDDNEDDVQMSFPKPRVFCPLLQDQNAPSSSSSIAAPNPSALQYSGPIFTPEFMSYNKTRDSYRRQLAVERSNLEHEIEALHQYDLDVRIQKQGERVRSVDEKIEETMVKMRAFFAAVPAAKDHLASIDALTDWLQTVTRLGQQNHTKKAVKDTINKNAKAIIALRK